MPESKPASFAPTEQPERRTEPVLFFAPSRFAFQFVPSSNTLAASCFLTFALIVFSVAGGKPQENRDKCGFIYVAEIESGNTRGADGTSKA